MKQLRDMTEPELRAFFSKTAALNAETKKAYDEWQKRSAVSEAAGAKARDIARRLLVEARKEQAT